MPVGAWFVYHSQSSYFDQWCLLYDNSDLFVSVVSHVIMS